MNAPFDHSLNSVVSDDGAFAVARSQCMDAFARLELAVGHAALRLGLTRNKDCLGRRVASLGKAVPSSALSKANHAKLPDWIRETETLVEIRATLVHAVMQIGLFGGSKRAVFANVADQLAHSPKAAQFDLRELRATCKTVEDQTAKLRQLVKGIPIL